MMRFFSARLAASIVAATGLLLGSAAVPMGAVSAQGTGPQKSAQQLVQDGLKAQKARNHVAAVTLFSRAINTGGLARKQMAYALMYRAKSNRARKQPAEAISDLNSALFFKNDLSSRDRANAIEERMKAFRDAGLKPTAIVSANPTAVAPEKAGASWGATTHASEPVTPSPRRRVVTTVPRQVLEPIKVGKPRTVASVLPAGAPILAPASDQPAPTAGRPPPVPAFQTRVSPRPVPLQPAPAAYRQSNARPTIERGVGLLPQRPERKRAQQPTGPWQVSSTKAQRVSPAWPASVQQQKGSATPVEPSAAVTPPKETADAVTSSSGSTTAGFGRFFANLLSGGSVANSTVPDAPPETAPATRARTTSVEAGIDRPHGMLETISKTSLIPSAGSSGRFEIRVAGFDSKDRADAVVSELLAQRSDRGLTGPKPKAEVWRSANSSEAATLYSVRYGRLDDLNQSLALCEQVKANGLTCNVVPLY